MSVLLTSLLRGGESEGDLPRSLGEPLCICACAKMWVFVRERKCVYICMDVHINIQIYKYIYTRIIYEYTYE